VYGVGRAEALAVEQLEHAYQVSLTDHAQLQAAQTWPGWLCQCHPHYRPGSVSLELGLEFGCPCFKLPSLTCSETATGMASCVESIRRGLRVVSAAVQALNPLTRQPPCLCN
jgi:hypothetical protein